MPFWRFTWLTALGSLPWVLGFGLIGRAVGDNWEQWRHHLQILDYLVVVGDRRRGRLPDREAAADAERRRAA